MLNRILLQAVKNIKCNLLGLNLHFKRVGLYISVSLRVGTPLSHPRAKRESAREAIPGQRKLVQKRQESELINFCRGLAARACAL